MLQGTGNRNLVIFFQNLIDVGPNKAIGPLICLKNPKLIKVGPTFIPESRVCEEGTKTYCGFYKRHNFFICHEQEMYNKK